MKHFINKIELLKLLSLWLPVLIQMGLIFYFSSQPSGSPALDRFPLPAKIGHLGGYGLLGFLLYRAFNENCFEWNRQAAGYSFITAFFYGLTDELHQSFVPGRNASAGDVLINAAGILLALGLIRFVINGVFCDQFKYLSRKINTHKGF